MTTRICSRVPKPGRAYSCVPTATPLQMSTHAEPYANHRKRARNFCLAAEIFSGPNAKHPQGHVMTKTKFIFSGHKLDRGIFIRQTRLQYDRSLPRYAYDCETNASMVEHNTSGGCPSATRVRRGVPFAFSDLLPVHTASSVHPYPARLPVRTALPTNRTNTIAE